MRVLDMTQPIKLTGEEGIYTNVNILEKITGRRRLEIAQFLQNDDLERFDRVGLNAIKEERVPGIEAVRRHCKLMVLGKPGAGKTTFLKYLAMNCIEGHLLAEHIPIFITLKDFAEADQRPDLLTYIKNQITQNESIQEILKQGQFFILLDGLDEVREEDTNRVIQAIQAVSDLFLNSHFVITCRIAAKEYVFAQFTEVEVADFDQEQISTFIYNWFRCKDPEKAESFADQIIKKLDENEPIQELASNPLLLTLLCLECEESLEFPRNRADLYERGLKV
jgi:predicted NACHT family NTPase